MTGVVITPFEGPNLHAKQALVRLTIDSESAWRLQAETFRGNLTERLPETPEWQKLRELLEDAARDQETVDLADVLAVLTAALQLGPPGESFEAWTETGRLAGKTDVLVPTVDADIGELTAVFAYDAAEKILSPFEEDAAARAGKDLMDAMRRFERERDDIGLSENIMLLVAAARARGIPARKLVRNHDVALLGHGTRRIRVMQSAGDRTSALASRISNDKTVTSRALRRAGIPVPKQRRIVEDEDLERAIAAIGFPLVIKGQTGSRGTSVTANIRDAGEIEAAVAKARRYSRAVLIEEHITGVDYRVLVVNGTMAVATRRRPAHVIGDGRSCIRALIAEENLRRSKAGGGAHWLVPLEIDADARAVLARQGLSPDSVPDAGFEARLRSTCNIFEGGLPEDVTDIIHPDVVAVAERAARLIGLDIAGVDVLTSDITRPLRETGGVINEVNHFPNLRSHYATETPPRDAAGAIVDYLLPAPERGRIPLVAVTGTNGKTTTCRLLHRIFSEAGLCTGLTTTHATMVGEEQIIRGDFANSVGAQAVLQDPRAEAAVLETSRGGIVRMGLGWDSCDVAVVTNISEDHLGQDGVDSLERIAEIKGMIVELAREAVVLNAENAFCRDMAARAAAPVWWFSSAPASPFIEEHLATGGDALLLDGAGEAETIVHCRGGERKEIVRVVEMPTSLGGLARYNVENALAASAAALAMDVPFAALRRALTGLTLSFADSPGRMNIRDVSGARLIVDYAHNVDGITKVTELLTKMPVRGNRLCFLVLGARHEPEAIDKVMATAAPYFDRFVVSGSLRRGYARTELETAQLLASGLAKSGVSQDAIILEGEERVGLRRALSLVRPGDLLLILADRRYEDAWAAVEAFSLPGGSVG